MNVATKEHDGEGSFNGALSLPWWELAGRFGIGLWLLVPGLYVAAGVAMQFDAANRAQRVGLASSGGIALLQVAAAILSMRGKFGAATVYAAISFTFVTYATFVAPVVSGTSESDGAPAMSAWSELIFSACALAWILGRRRARGGGHVSLRKGTSVALIGALALEVPILGYGLANGLGLLLSPPFVEARVMIGQRLPRARVGRLDGRAQSLTEPGVVYVVNFWATWCAPCLRELPHLIEMSKSWPKDTPVRLLAVNTEHLTRGAIESFLEKNRLEGLPVYVDPWGLKDSLGYDTIPLTLVLRDGEILAVHSGYGESLMGMLGTEIRGALDRQPRPAR